MIKARVVPGLEDGAAIAQDLPNLVQKRKERKGYDVAQATSATEAKAAFASRQEAACSAGPKAAFATEQETARAAEKGVSWSQEVGRALMTTARKPLEWQAFIGYVITLAVGFFGAWLVLHDTDLKHDAALSAIIRREAERDAENARLLANQERILERVGLLDRQIAIANTQMAFFAEYYKKGGN